MKILQVCPIFPPEKGDFAGGVTQEVHDFSKELVRRGHQVEVYCANALDINRKALSCIKCSGACESACPHGLSIKDRLVRYDNLLC